MQNDVTKDKNYEKQDRYKRLHEQLTKAIKNEFWFEACMIEYAILEDRTSAILYYGKVCGDAYSSRKKLGNKLNSIEYQIGKKHPIISKKVDPNLISQLKEWKEKRNDLVHRACVSYEEERAAAVAMEGIILIRRLQNDSAKVTRAAKKEDGNG